MEEAAGVPREYLCPSCGDMADVRTFGELTDQGRVTGIRLRCSRSHEWTIPGKSGLNLVMDPWAEALYDLADRRIAEERRSAGGST